MSDPLSKDLSSEPPMYSSSTPRRPHVNIPAGARAPVNPSPSARQDSYSLEVTPPPYSPEDDEGYPTMSWGESSRYSLAHTPSTPRQRTSSLMNLHSRPSSQTQEIIAFPEPQIFRATSATASLEPSPPPLTHRHSRSDVSGSRSPTLQRLQRGESAISVASSYYAEDDAYAVSNEGHGENSDSRDEISQAMLMSEEGIARFQAGTLPEKNEDWHLLVPEEAREALGKQEVQRQSVIFEVFKSEREYVADLMAVRDVFIEPLRNRDPPIIASHLVAGFLFEVFGNLGEILSHHQSMLGALFSRQRDQHPLIQSVADIILDTTLRPEFRESYSTYIKHYPLSESYHRNTLSRTPQYQTFVNSASADPRIRKRDLITFLSRPVTRLPRLNLLLEQILKLTPDDHPDKEILPIILGILKDSIRATQPGIEAAESKVKFWALSESLVFRKGEILDLDLYDKSRTLHLSDTVTRKMRSDAGFSSWVDFSASLLDNAFLITRDDKRPNGSIKRFLVSRPLPLSYLRLGAFNGPAESKKDREASSSLTFRNKYVEIYPFTIYHAANALQRRYTLYASSEAARKKWYTTLHDAIGLHKAREESNMFFEPKLLTDKFFRVSGPGGNVLGRISCAVPFISAGRKFIAVGCSTGIYVSVRNGNNYIKALQHPSPSGLEAIQVWGGKAINRLIVLHDSNLFCCSLHVLGQIALGQADQKALLASKENISGQDSNVVFFKRAFIGQRAILIYAAKRHFQSTLTLNVLEAVDLSDAFTPKSSRRSKPKSFRPFGEPGFVPKDAYDITTLSKTIGICANDGIAILDPTNVAKSAATFVPDFSTSQSNHPMLLLKAKVAEAKALGLVRWEGSSELLVIYDTLGCYITKHGVPTRSSGFIKWEATATSFAQRGVHVLLMSSEFIEVRNVMTGRLVQVIEGQDMRLTWNGESVNEAEDPVLVAMRGDRSEREGTFSKIVELVETREISAQTPASPLPPQSASSSGGASASANSRAALWDEWDM